MLSSLIKFAVLATLAIAQCEPSSTSSSSGTGPTSPPTGSTQLHPNGNTGKCIDIQGANFANGTPVQIYDCNGTGAQKFQISRGDGLVKVAGTNFCLDAGTNPTSGSKVHLWQCYPGLTQQQWYWTGDDRIAVTGQGLCLDLPSGSLTNGNALQVWECGTGNSNQVWTSGSNMRRRDRIMRRRALGL